MSMKYLLFTVMAASALMVIVYAESDCGCIGPRVETSITKPGAQNLALMAQNLFNSYNESSLIVLKEMTVEVVDSSSSTQTWLRGDEGLCYKAGIENVKVAYKGETYIVSLTFNGGAIPEQNLIYSTICSCTQDIAGSQFCTAGFLEILKERHRVHDCNVDGENCQ